VSEKTYTLDEARIEMARRECVANGHPPNVEMRRLCEPLGKWLCDCGQVTWEPREPEGVGPTIEEDK
jgi:hypothetical protein